jgi:hypothetical protein
LAGFREVVGVLSVHDGPGFIEPVDEGSVFGVGPSFLRAPAHAEVPVAQRQHRFQLGQEFGVKLFFDDVPLVHGVIVRWLSRLDRGALVLEFLALIALVISLGSVARVWLSGWGALLVGVVLAGILFPLALHTRSHLLGRLSVPTGAVLVLLGGFLLRMVIMLSSEGV